MTQNIYPDINNWREFRKIVKPGTCNLLQRLGDFRQAVLIAGCQRSGTTMLAQIITHSEGMADYYWLGPDGELDAALLLGGYATHTPDGRCCFQTTYLNECYPEYERLTDGQKLVWVVRNPHSVIYSMLYNWHDHSLNALFNSCGANSLAGKERLSYQLLGPKGVSRLIRACLGYNSKVSQIFDLTQRLGPDKMMVVDYDILVQNKDAVLPQIYAFINLPYQQAYADKIHVKSLKKSSGLAPQEAAKIESLCMPIYAQAQTLLTQFTLA